MPWIVSNYAFHDGQIIFVDFTSSLLTEGGIYYDQAIGSAYISLVEKETNLKNDDKL